MPKVSVIIPTMSGREELLARLVRSVPRWCEVIVVGGDKMLLAEKRNIGAMRASGEYLLFIDDDNHLEDGAIVSALELCSEPGVGIVGLMACYDDKKDVVADGGSKRNYLTGFTRGINTNENWRTLTKLDYEVDEIANAFMMHRELFFKLGGFDEKRYPIDLDEAHFCKRAKNLGLKIIVDPMARCYHKSITYSHIPDFRRPLNAYCMGKHRIQYQRDFNTNLRYITYLVFFMPLFVSFYTLSLIYRKKPGLIKPFIEGVIHGLQGRIENKYKPQ